MSTTTTPGYLLGDGNDFVLTAIPSTVVWDGRVDGGAITVSNDWTIAANWVGDAVPSPGDAIMFNDIGIGNGKNLPFNDFPALSQFGIITFANTSGSYTVTGNSITLALPAAANIVSDNTLNIAVSNSFNVANHHRDFAAVDHRQGWQHADAGWSGHTGQPQPRR